MFASVLSLGACSVQDLMFWKKKEQNEQNEKEAEPGNKEKNLALSFSFEDVSGSKTKDNVSGEKYKIDYVFSEDNAASLFKKPNDPLQKQGVSGKSLYMDGFSTRIRVSDYEAPKNKLTFSTWVAPRGFENLNKYGNEFNCKGHPRMTALFDWGHMENDEGFLFGLDL